MKYVKNMKLKQNKMYVYGRCIACLINTGVWYTGNKKSNATFDAKMWSSGFGWQAEELDPSDGPWREVSPLEKVIYGIN